MAQPLLPLRSGAFQCLADVPAEHELAAQDLHRLPDSRADHGLPQPSDRAAKGGLPPFRTVVGTVQHLAGQEQREGRRVYEWRAAVAELLRPIRARQLVVDQLVGRVRIGNAQQGLGEAHERDAFVAAKIVGVEKGVEARRLVSADAFDERAGNRLRLGGLGRV